MYINQYIDALKKYKTMYNIIVHTSLEERIIDNNRNIKDYFYYKEEQTNYPIILYYYCMEEHIADILTPSYYIVDVKDGSRVVLLLKSFFRRDMVSDPWLDIKSHNVKNTHPLIPYKIWKKIYNK